MPAPTPPPSDAGDRPDREVSGGPVRPAGRKPLGSLADVQNQLIQKYFQLERIERRLSQEARRQDPDPGRSIIRQIELERQRLGRDLHTGLGQLLAATRLQLETIEGKWPAAPPEVRRALDRIAELTIRALDQVRAVSHRLHPPEWQRLSLSDAVRQLWDLSGLPERTTSRIAVAPDLASPNLEAKILLYRALQEGLSNIARHSRATSVAVSLEARGGGLLLTVTDNGVGFDAHALWNSPPSLNSGIGLRAIREQARALGGELSVRSGPDGTTLEVSVPNTEPPTP